ncbi:bifunctional oligoribonuclease/PAP phosphatase NrnA [Planctomycetota bacterium]
MEISKITRLKFPKLVKLLQDKSTLLIVMQDNPDPDSIAAAVALRKFANAAAGLKCSIAHGGTVGRGENRALVQYLNLNLLQCSQVKFEQYDLIAIVDTQPGTGNNSLPQNIVPQIVFDHHPFKNTTRLCKFYDVRREYGSTSTILLEYLSMADLVPDTPLATALLYAIRSDTQDLGREAAQADIKAIELLYPLANKRMLSGIQRGSVPKEYFRMLSNALQDARVYGNSILTHIGQINNPDMIGEVADFFLREDETNWTMCSGFYGNRLLLSIRTSQEQNRADKVIKSIVARRGTGGGHLTYARGQIPLKNGTESERRNLKKQIERKFLRAVGMAGVRCSKLLAE